MATKRGWGKVGEERRKSGRPALAGPGGAKGSPALAGDGPGEETPEDRLRRNLSWQNGPGKVWKQWLTEAARDLATVKADGARVPISPLRLVEAEIVGYTFDFERQEWVKLDRTPYALTEAGIALAGEGA